MCEPCDCGDPECKQCYPFRRNGDEWDNTPEYEPENEDQV